ncbi:MAG: GxxExxY protein [Candidatus Methanoperedens sp.]|nr:GxxExxY protein [Candidatus Methanoperedens sp.]CAG1005914.1 hypothetical protein METP1_03288 [Methanosarcinales archaeon]
MQECLFILTRGVVYTNADERRLIKTDEETCFLNRNSIVNPHIIDEIIAELKTFKEFHDIHIAQSMKYIKITNLKLCTLINFGKPRVDLKRIVRGIGNK